MIQPTKWRNNFPRHYRFPIPFYYTPFPSRNRTARGPGRKINTGQTLLFLISLPCFRLSIPLLFNQSYLCFFFYCFGSIQSRNAISAEDILQFYVRQKSALREVGKNRHVKRKKWKREAKTSLAIKNGAKGMPKIEILYFCQKLLAFKLLRISFSSRKGRR